MGFRVDVKIKFFGKKNHLETTKSTEIKTN